MDTLLFIVSKILSPLASPLCVALVIALVLILRIQRTMERPRLRVTALGLWILAFVVSTPLVEEATLAIWEVPLGDEAALVSEFGSQKADAIVVLGGTVDPAASGSWHIELNDTAERLVDAARLYKLGLAPWILVSGGSGDLYHPERKEAPYMREVLVSFGVPDDAILVEDQSRNTYENAVDSKRVLDGKNLKKIILVTSAVHMRRSDAIFRKAGFSNLIPFAVDTRKRPLAFPELLIPDARSLWHLSLVFREMLGYLAYGILGRL